MTPMNLFAQTNSEVDTPAITQHYELEEIDIKERKRKRPKFGEPVDTIAVEKAKFMLGRALQSIDAGDYKVAQKWIKKSLQTNPNYKEAWLVHGDLFSAFGYCDKAIQQYDKVLILDSAVVEAHYNKGNCLFKQGDLDQAANCFERALKYYPDYQLALGGRAALNMEQKNFKEAIVDYNRLIELNYYFLPAYKGRGVAHMNIGEYKKAILDFTKVLEKEPKDAYALFQRGLAMIYSDRVYDGCAELLKAEALGSQEAGEYLKKYCN